MNTDLPDQPASPDDRPLSATEAAATDAPVVKRRSRAAPKKAAADDAGSAAGVGASPAIDAESAEVPTAATPDAPATKRAPRKPRAPRVAAADLSPAELDTRRTPDAVSAVPPEDRINEPEAAVASQVADGGVFSLASEFAPSGDGTGAVTGPASDFAAGGQGEEGGRGRGRRRGRRGGRGGEDGLPGDSRVQEGGAGPLSASSVVVPDAAELFASLVSGEFDVAADEADASTEADEPGQVVEAPVDDKRVLAPDPDAPKLHKVLAQSGIGSRRDMEQAIQDGRVKVNGEVAHTGMRISFGDRVQLDDKPVRVRIAPPPPRVIAYHKPVGELVTHDDPQQRPTVFRRLPRLAQGKWQSVGRLDINTEGLLLFTNSGDLANKLMHPRFGVEREYAVRVLGTLEKEAKAQLIAGVSIEGQTAAFKSIEDGGGEGVNHWYRVVITEGRNREVRKLFDAVGLTVSRLIRVRYGCVLLPRGLKRGVCVDLSETDIKALRMMTGNQPPRGDARGDARGGAPSGRPEGRPPQQQQNQGKRGPQGQPERPPRDRPDAGRPPAPNGKPNRNTRGPRPALGDELPRDFREPGDPARIPNPLQQTYDKRAILSDRAARHEDDFEDGPIPNPLQQTYDKRFVQNAPGFSGPRGSRSGKPSKGGAPRQPDPMQTAVGYIGADAFTRKMQTQQGRGPSKGGKRRAR